MAVDSNCYHAGGTMEHPDEGPWYWVPINYIMRVVEKGIS